jgi:predicted secreted protein
VVRDLALKTERGKRDREPSQLRSRVGDEFEVRLEGNPSTGFVWKVNTDSSPETAGSFVLLNSDWDPVRSETVGGPNVQVFRFRALTSGEVTLTFEYRRPWDRNKEASQIRTYNLTID